MASNNDEIGIYQSPFFMEYHKIQDDSTKWNFKDLNKIKEWVVLEKVHGANFSFYISNEGLIQVARRGAFLSLSENFFGVRNTNIIPETSEKLRHLYKQISTKYPNILQLSLHGELFGGVYKHPEVLKSQLAIRPIQHGVMYAPDLHFIVFDIAIYHSKSEREFLEYDTVIDICRSFDLLCCSPLLCGRFSEAIGFSLDFITTVPLKFSLPQITAFPNLAEGIIIKPLKNSHISTPKGMRRLILKRKHPNFVEKKIHRGGPIVNTYNPKNDVVLLVRYELFALINSNRIQSAISKIGFPTTESEVSNIVQSVIDDIFLEFTTEQNETYSLLNEEDLFQLRSLCTSEVDKLLQEEFIPQNK